MIAIAPHLQPQPHHFPSPTSIPLSYIEATVPAGMTLREYRRGLPRAAGRWQRLKELAGAAR